MRVVQITLTAADAETPAVDLEVEWIPPIAKSDESLPPGDLALMSAVTAMMIGFATAVSEDEP